MTPMSTMTHVFGDMLARLRPLVERFRRTNHAASSDVSMVNEYRQLLKPSVERGVPDIREVDLREE
jgi:hypothetical protein